MQAAASIILYHYGQIFVLLLLLFLLVPVFVFLSPVSVTSLSLYASYGCWI